MKGRGQSAVILVAVLGLMAAGAPLSAQATAPLPVTAVVLNTCVVQADPLVFVDYSPISDTPTSASSEIRVLTCFDAHEIAIDKCQHGADVSNRQMKIVLDLGSGETFGEDTLDYQISCATDAECQANWGDQQGADTHTGVISAAETYTVNGVIPEGQLVPSGAYEDMCTVSLQF